MENILLVEPNYKNKYPPIGLMKISTYHKNKGDNVVFVKGFIKNIPAKKWQRVYITSLFTFEYKQVVKTINYYKKFIDDDNIFIGGILASLMKNELITETGLKNIITGQLYDSKLIGFQDEINIDSLSLDYSILDDIDYVYPAGDNHIYYITRGCPNKCSFCAVPRLEPVFIESNRIKDAITTTEIQYGSKRNLLLLDNNVLFSSHLESIVQNIIDSGFGHDSFFLTPYFAQYTYKLHRLQDEQQNPSLLRNMSVFLINFTRRIKKIEDKEIFEEIIKKITLLSNQDAYQFLNDNNIRISTLLNKYSDKRKKKRYVDFNQGIDARLLTEEKMAILSKLPLNPLRIAFDSINNRNEYISAVELAHKYNVKRISNYLLYNYFDAPIDLWERIRINIDLNKKYGMQIFSFPMKFASIYEKDRSYIGRNWNKKFLTGVTAILHANKGIVAAGENYFYRAFGKTSEEFIEILSMPRDFIIYRSLHEETGETNAWREKFLRLSSVEKADLCRLVSLGMRHRDEIEDIYPGLVNFYFPHK
jgi:hypothetical protein